MGIVQILSTETTSYQHCKLVEGMAFDNDTLAEFDTVLQKLLSKSQRIIIEVPSNCKLRCTPANLKSVLQKLPIDDSIFVANDAFPGGILWISIYSIGFSLTTALEKAKAWASQTTIGGKIRNIDLAGSVYLKCVGDIGNCSEKLEKALEQVVANKQLCAEILSDPQPIVFENFTSWTFLQGAIIFDFADTLSLNKEFFSRFGKILRKYNVAVDSNALYFVSSGTFQKWLLGYALKLPIVQGLSNIVRVVNTEKYQKRQLWAADLQHIAQISSAFSPQPLAVIHVATDNQTALHVSKLFYPVILLTDKTSDANYLVKNASGERRLRIHHLTPTRSGVDIWSPDLITGENSKFLAEYLVSRCRNYDGYPNDTHIYDFVSPPACLRDVIAVFIGNFAHVIDERLRMVLETVGDFELKDQYQGNLNISLLEDQLLKLTFSLSIPTKWATPFWTAYKKMFSNHFLAFCRPLELFSKTQLAPANTQILLHLLGDFNEIVLRDDIFSIEIRLQKDRGILLIKSPVAEKLQNRYASFFVLLGMNIFPQLPDKEILQQIFSLLWENCQKENNSSGDLVVTLFATENKTKLKIAQGAHNRLVLFAGDENKKSTVQFVADIMYRPQSRQQLLQLLALFTPTCGEGENSWQRACREAVSHTIYGLQQPQLLSINFSIVDTRWTAQFLCEEKAPCPINKALQAVFHSGVDHVDATPSGRKITLGRDFAFSKSPVQRPATAFRLPMQKRQPQTKLPKSQLPKSGNLQTQVKIPKQYREQVANLPDKAAQLSEMRPTVRRKKAPEFLPTEPKSTKKNVFAVESTLQSEVKKMSSADILHEVEEIKSTGLEESKRKLQETYQKALETYNRKYADIEDTQPQGKTLEKALEIRALQKDKTQERKLQKVFRYLAIVCFGCLLLSLVSMGMLFSHSTPVPKHGIVKIDTNSPDYRLPAPTEKTKPVKTPLRNNPAQALINLVCFNINHGQPPEQRVLNAMLKKLYFCREEWKNGDVYNLTARLYWYKIHLDRNQQMFRKSRIARWREEARRALQRAVDKYQTLRVKTCVKFVLQPWKPEKSLYPSDTRIITYANPREAIRDIENLQNHLPR